MPFFNKETFVFVTISKFILFMKMWPVNCN
jgi:hypothetical protein